MAFSCDSQPAVCGIINRKRFVSGSFLRQALGQPVMQGASSRCIQAKEKPLITDTVILFKFHIENITVRALSVPDFIIILVHTGYRTGHRRPRICSDQDRSHTFSLLHLLSHSTARGIVCRETGIRIHMGSGHQGIDICLRISMIEKKDHRFWDLMTRAPSLHADTAAFRIKLYVISLP